MRNITIIIFIALIMTTSCDENFWGYNYDAPALINVTRIQGNLSDKFSGDPIHPATININGQETMTDETGNYLLNYIIPDEIEPNQQEIGYLSIIAPDYLPYTKTFFIYPVENKIDVELEYSVPTVLDAVCDGDTVQSIIRDYQGFKDIYSVTVTFKILDTLGIGERKEFDMNIIQNINNVTSCYQYIIWKTIINDSLRSDWYRITAKDSAGHVHRADFTISLDDTMFFHSGSN